MQRLVPLAICLLTIISILARTCTAQQAQANNCTKFYRNTFRNGFFLMGKLSIPMSKDSRAEDGGEGFKLVMKFSRAVRALSVRRATARDMGSSHTEFEIDASPKNGIMTMDTVIRLMSFRGRHLPSVTRIIFNNKALCGAPLSEGEATDSIIVEVAATTTALPTTADYLNKLIPGQIEGKPDYEYY